MAEKSGGGGVVGGILAIVGIVLVVGFRLYRAEMRAESLADRSGQSAQKMVELASECRDHAHALMDLAPDVARVGEYLHWSVRVHHNAAWEKICEDFGGPASSTYRDTLLDLMIERAAKDGREAETRSLEKVKLYSRAAGETWWEIKKL